MEIERKEDQKKGGCDIRKVGISEYDVEDRVKYKCRPRVVNSKEYGEKAKKVEKKKNSKVFFFY